MTLGAAGVQEPTLTTKAGTYLRILYSLICEDAHVRQDGRVDVHGIFRQLYAPGFPAQQDRLVLAIDVEWDEGETGRREFRIDLMDPGASPVFTINGHTDVNAVAEGEPPPLTRLIMPLDDVPFPEAGSYLFEFESGDRRIPLAPIHLIENPDAV